MGTVEEDTNTAKHIPPYTLSESNGNTTHQHIMHLLLDTERHNVTASHASIKRHLLINSTGREYHIQPRMFTCSFKKSLSAFLISMCEHNLFIYLFGVLRRFQHCTGHITTGSWKGRGNQYIQFVRVLYCKLLTNGKQLPAFPLETMLGIEPRPQRWEARVLPLCHRGPP